jgi:hypothetical protein
VSTWPGASVVSLIAYAGRILYLALADGRGHLMRAHLLRRAIGAEGIGVDIVTTARSGVRFLEGLGTPARLLSEHFRVEFGDRHDMSRVRTDRRVLNYLLLPWRAAADLSRLAVWARGMDLVVNDSLHPALLLAPALGFPRPVVQLYGENLWRAMEDNLDDRAPAWVAHRYRRGLQAVRARAFARIIHTLGSTEPDAGLPRTFRLVPLVAAPERNPAQVRAELGVPPGARLAAVYLNPHFRHPTIAAAVEEGLRRGGYRFHAVGEGYAGRPGWVATDARFGDVVHAADVFVSGAGMGALELARSAGTPLLVLLGDQPEQARNVAELHRLAPDFALRSVLVGDPDLASAIDAVTGALPLRCPAATPARSPATSAWIQAFQQLVHAARAHASRGLPATGRRPALGPGVS